MPLGLPITDNGYKRTRGIGLNASYNFGNATVLGGMKVAGEIDSMIFADVGLNHSGFFVKGQTIHTKMDSESTYMQNNSSLSNDSGTFYAAKAGWGNDNYRVSVALVSNDDNMAVHGIDHDVDTNVIHVGYRFMDDFGTQGGQEGMDAMGIGAGTAYGKFSLDGGYAKATDMTKTTQIMLHFL